MQQTFKQFLSEENFSPINEEHFQLFVKNCSEYFNNCGSLDKVLYRGIKKAEMRQFRINSFIPEFRNFRNGRNPIDTHPAIHDAANDYFESKFKLPFRNGMMVSGSINQASDYVGFSGNGGGTIIIIPANDYTLCFSKTISDFFSDIAENIGEKYDFDDPDYHEIDRMNEDLFNKMDKANYVAGPEYTKDAIASQNEVMLYSTVGTKLGYYTFSKGFWDSMLYPKLQKHFSK